MRWPRFACLALALLGFCVPALAGNQQYEPLSASVQAALSGAISDKRPPVSSFSDPQTATRWLTEASARLARRLPDPAYRLELLRAIHYEATRAGLDPELVLGLIEVESAFRKYAVSSAGARGYMQVMPFWVGLIGQPTDNLFHLRTNLRYGCTILRHYLDIERGDLFRALGRYNGSLGRAEYPNKVKAAWLKWQQTEQRPPKLAETGKKTMPLTTLAKEP
ncbi:MAG: lytic transglycosylase domain-containing protein [Zoogloeaceae bacterium]|jgi:soluble lytic murein transglycosylase-like protein|nr:lytic transglycosylase domain-containing protein [Zoogloeaceae bacterium]